MYRLSSQQFIFNGSNQCDVDQISTLDIGKTLLYDQLLNISCPRIEKFERNI